jgi:transcriptional regulator with XRE-family HTH domain
MVLHARVMPKLNATFQQLRKEADWSTDELAAMLGLAGGSLRNVEAGREPMSDRRIYLAARLFSTQIHRPIAYDDLVSTGNDGVPDEPPGQPEPAPKPPPKRKEKAGKGPKRPAERGVA